MRAFWKISNVGVCVILFSLFAVGEEVTNKVETAVPSEQVIKSFVTSFNLKPDGKETVELKVNARQAVLPKRVMEIYKQKGTIPFAVSVQLKKISRLKWEQRHKVFLTARQRLLWRIRMARLSAIKQRTFRPSVPPDQAWAVTSVR